MFLDTHFKFEKFRFIPNEKLMKYSGVKDKDGFVPLLEGHAKTVTVTYQLVFTTKPGNAKYEVDFIYKIFTINFFRQLYFLRKLRIRLLLI